MMKSIRSNNLTSRSVRQAQVEALNRTLALHGEFVGNGSLGGDFNLGDERETDVAVLDEETNAVNSVLALYGEELDSETVSEMLTGDDNNDDEQFSDAGAINRVLGLFGEEVEGDDDGGEVDALDEMLVVFAQDGEGEEVDAINKVLAIHGESI
jgi:hypothetical protein